MRMRLATKPNAKACAGELCGLNSAFDAQVQQLGERLTTTAYKAYPDLRKRVPGFTFIVVDKKEPGMASNGGGKVVIFRGTQHLELSEDAFNFILAREMGHVIGQHHNKNTSTKIIFSVLASVLFPAVSLISASNVAAQATSTAVTSIASTATSYIGSEAVISKIKPSQLLESDNIAIKLLDTQGWDIRSVASILLIDDVQPNGWLKDLNTTAQYLDGLIDKADTEAPLLEAESLEVKS